MLLHHLLTSSISDRADKIALVCDNRSHTYRELGSRASIVAAELQRLGVRRGDRVALFLDNNLEFVVSLFAVLSVGAVFMPINPLTKTDKLAYMLNDSRATALVTQASLAMTYVEALAQNQSLLACMVVGPHDSIDTRVTSITRRTAA